jgi:uncharacterized protein (TIGR02996 family)
MDEREALIQTIIDNPDDDTPRLVYADWQEEHGDAAHAELIRAQCELARLPAQSKKRGPLEAREAELLARPENAALAEFGNGFERGMVRCARWFADDPFDFDGVPLERVLLLDAANFGDSNWPDVAAAARVAAAPWAVRIPRIEFHEYRVDAPVVPALAASPHLRNLRAVRFSDSTAAPDALADLLLGPSVRGVDALVLDGETGTWAGLDAALARVLADPRAARLRRLGLQAFSVPAAVADVLLTAPGLEVTEVCVSTQQPWLTPAVRAALEARFGPRLHVEWSSIATPETWT